MTSSIISVSVKSGKCFAYPDFHSAVQSGCPGDLILEESQVYPIPDYQALDELQKQIAGCREYSERRKVLEVRLKDLIRQTLKFEERLAQDGNY